MKKIKEYFTFDNMMQVGLLVTTTIGYLLMSMKLPQYGLIVSFVAQIFWLYSAHKAWKEAGQIAIFINTVMLTVIFGYGVVNYWWL